MTPLTADLIASCGAAAGIVVAPEHAAQASEMLGGLVGAWPTRAPTRVVSRPGDDEWGAVVRVIDTDSAATTSGALAGLTVAIKDNIAVAGVPTAIGSGLPGFVGDLDATVVARIRAAGASIVAKAQCEAFLLGAESFTSRLRPVANPHDPARSAGGSSSGSAAMLAAGLVDLALGTDSGGSIRIPASHCGVVGFMPTRGRVPYTGIVPLEPFLERVGPMARSVSAVAALFDVLDGGDSIDPRCGWRIGRERVWSGPDARITLGVPAAALAMCSPEIAAAFDAALARLRAADLCMQEFDWETIAEAAALHTPIYVIGDALSTSGATSAIAASQPSDWAEWRTNVAQENLPPLTCLSHAAGLALHRADPGLYARAIAAGLACAEALDAALADVAAIILPVSPSPPPLIPPDIAAASAETLYGDTGLTAAFNVTGHPVVSLPAGSVSGMPFGVQLVGARGDDLNLLRVATVVEGVFGLAPSPSQRTSS